MTTCKKVIGGFIGLYMLAAVSLAHAQDAPGPDGAGPKWHPGQRIQEIFKQLNLTDDQQKQLEANKQQHRAQMEGERQKMKGYRDAFQQELMKIPLDMARINDIHNQTKVLLSQMEDDRLASILAVRSILTPQQFQEFVNLMHKHRPPQPDHGE